jgi:O-antigen/teichoic acid export membrane protein
MKDLLKTFLIYGMATFVDKLIAFLFIPVYAKYFSVVEFGKMELILSLISIFSIFVFLQLETSLQRYFFDLSGEQIKIFFSTIIYFVITISLLVCFVIIGLSEFLSSFILSDSSSAGLIMWGAFQIPFICLYTFSTIMLRFSKRYSVFVKVIIVSSVCNLFFPIYLVILQNMGLRGYFIAQFFSILAVSLFSIYHVREYIVAGFSLKDLKMALHYALPQFPARVGSTINAYANRFFINGYIDQYSMGIFAMAFKVSSILQVFYQFFVTFWNQMLFEVRQKKNHKEILADIFNLFNPIVFLLVSFFCLFSRDILLLISDKFAEGDYLIGMITFSIALLLLKEIVDVGPKYLKKTSLLSVNFIFSVVVNVISLFVLVPLWGLKGVAISLVVTNFVLLILSWYNSNRIYFIPFKKSVILLNALPCLFLIYMNYSNVILDFIIYKIVISIGLLFIYGFGISIGAKKFYLSYGN